MKYINVRLDTNSFKYSFERMPTYLIFDQFNIWSINYILVMFWRQMYICIVSIDSSIDKTT